MAGNSIKILAIDDNQDNLISIRALIREAFPDAATFTAQYGAKGYELAVAEDPDVILLDIIMPGMDGFEVCKKLKADSKLRDIPVVFITALKGDKESRIRALECGAEAFIAKPIDEYELTAQIRAMVKIKTANLEKRDEKERLAALVEEKTRELCDAHNDAMGLLDELKSEIESRKKIENTLRESKNRLKTLINSMPDIVCFKDGEGRWLEANDYALRFFQLDGVDYRGKNDSELADFSSFFQQSFLVCEETDSLAWLNREITRIDEVMPQPDGANKIFDMIKVPTFDAQGQRKGLIVVGRDVTEKVRAEKFREITREILQILNEPGELKGLIHNVLVLLQSRMEIDAVGIRLQDGDDYPYLAHHGYSGDFLLKENSLLGRAADNGVCMDADGKPNLQCTCGLVLSGKTDPLNPLFTAGGSFWTNDSFALLHIPRDADPRHQPRNECIHSGYASVALVPIYCQEKVVGLLQYNDRSKGVFSLDMIESLEGIASHIGEALVRKRVEEEKNALELQFQHAQKLESLGVLAGGIAHDFNNILTIIMGYCSLIKMDYQHAADHIPDIERAGQRAADLCRQMLAYAGKASFTLTQINMSILVDEMVRMLKATLNQNLVISYDFSVDVPSITGDASQIRQIVMNLIINAAEAIGEEQGDICVTLENIAISAGQPTKDYLGANIPSGKYVCLKVADNGCGMNNETVGRIFEPFYTTKFTGRGLGMSAVLGIITAHKGALQLVSKPGQGTTFKVYLPAEIGVQIGDEFIKQASSEPWQGSGTVLLVEDEEQIIMVAHVMLKKMGFKVIGAANGQEALELYQKNEADISLVVTDLGMPVMDGYRLFRELKILNPELPIIISSGFGDALITSGIQHGEVAGFVCKPYSYNKLRDVLKSVAESASSTSIGECCSNAELHGTTPYL